MEPNKQNKLTNKIETDSYIPSVRREGVSGLGKKGEESKEKIHTDNRLWLQEGKGGEEGRIGWRGYRWWQKDNWL